MAASSGYTALPHATAASAAVGPHSNVLGGSVNSAPRPPAYSPRSFRDVLDMLEKLQLIRVIGRLDGIRGGDTARNASGGGEVVSSVCEERGARRGQRESSGREKTRKNNNVSLAIATATPTATGIPQLPATTCSSDAPGETGSWYRVLCPLARHVPPL